MIQSTPYIDVNEFEMFNNKPECQSNHNFEKIYKTYKGFYFKNLKIKPYFIVFHYKMRQKHFYSRPFHSSPPSLPPHLPYIYSH